MLQNGPDIAVDKGLTRSDHTGDYVITELPTLVRTLLLNGYTIDSVQRSDAAQTLKIHRIDKLGACVNYLLLAAESPSEDVIIPFQKRAAEFHATAIGLGNFTTPLFSVLPLAGFYRLLGGSIDEVIIYDDGLPKKLDDLGHNRVPSGLSGMADDLLEDYTKQCLQFVTGRRSRRYGRERLFEPVPDGIVFEDGAILIDTKAYSGGFEIQADDVKRFASYVNDFNSRYSSELGRVHSFVVVTGHFTQSEGSIEARRAELYAECETQLTCLAASDLGMIVEQLRQMPRFRGAIGWNRLFSRLFLTPALVREECERVRKDGVI